MDLSLLAPITRYWARTTDNDDTNKYIYTSDKIDKFIELRAQGRSLARIALDLDISKRTAVDWNRQFQTEIVSLRQFELEAIHEKFALTFERELSHLAKQRNAVEQELATRDFRRVPTEKLLRLPLMLPRQIQDLRPSCCETPVASSPEPTIAPAHPETPVDPRQGAGRGRDSPAGRDGRRAARRASRFRSRAFRLSCG